MKLTLCIDRQTRDNPSVNIREYQIYIGYPLRSIDDTYDELKIITDDDKKLVGSIIRRCFVDKYGVLKKLDNEEIQELSLPEITLFQGDNYIYIKEYDNLNMKVQYLSNIEMNKYFALKSEMNSTIQETIDSILLKVFRKDDIAELISEINMSPEKIKIKSGKIELEGYTTINGGFSIDKNGSPIITNGSVDLIDESTNNANSKFSIKGANGSRTFLKPFIFDIYNGDPVKLGSKEFIVNLLSNSSSPAQLQLTQVYEAEDGYAPKKFGFDVEISKDYQSISLSGPQKTVFIIDNNYGLRVDKITADVVNSTAFNNTSLESKKKNIELFHEGLDLINRSDFYLYNYKTENDNDKKHIGLVIGKDYNTPEEFMNNEKDSIDLYSFVSACGDAIKTLSEKNKILEERIEVLENGRK